MTPGPQVHCNVSARKETHRLMPMSPCLPAQTFWKVWYRLGGLLCLVSRRPLWPTTLDWLQLCSSGCFWWDHWLCQTSQSLAAGLGAYQLSQEPLGFLAILGTLAGLMGMRFYHSGRMPAGLIVAASLLMVVAKFGISVLNRSHQ